MFISSLKIAFFVYGLVDTLGTADLSIPVFTFCIQLCKFSNKNSNEAFLYGCKIIQAVLESKPSAAAVVCKVRKQNLLKAT